MQGLRVNVPTSLYVNAPEPCFACVCLVILEVFVFEEKKKGLFVVVGV